MRIEPEKIVSVFHNALEILGVPTAAVDFEWESYYSMGTEASTWTNGDVIYVRIDPLACTDPLLSVCHEAVHCKQIYFNEITLEDEAYLTEQLLLNKISS